MSDETWYDPDGHAVLGLPQVPETNRTRTFYKPNFRSFGRFIRSAQARKPTIEIAHAIARRAGEYSPRSNSPEGGSDDGPLAESFQVRPEAGELKVDGALRVKVEVFSSDSAAAPMEFGNEHVGKPGRRSLARAGADYGDFKSGARA